MYYIDTSVLVAYYCPEALSEPVQDFLPGVAGVGPRYVIDIANKMP